MTERTMWIWIALATVAVAGIVVVVELWPAQNSGLVLKPGDREVVAAGAQIYAEQCAACHGGNLEGQPN